MKCALIALLSACMVMAGCTSTRHVPFGNLPANEAPALDAGETVRVVLKSGQVRRLKIAAVDHDTITGRDLDSAGSGVSIQLALADVQTMEVRHVNSGRTTALVLGILAGVVLLAFYGTAAAQCGSSLDDCGD